MNVSTIFTFICDGQCEVDLRNLGPLLSRKVGNIVLGTNETILLSSPPAEANGLADLELGEAQSNLEDTNAAGAVVVETRALGDGVGVGTCHDNVLLVTLLGGGNEVAGPPQLIDGPGVDSTSESAGLSSSADGDSIFARERDGGDVRALRARRRTESTSERTRNVVVEGDTTSASSASERNLETELAGASRDQSNVALDGLGEIALQREIAISIHALSL